MMEQRANIRHLLYMIVIVSITCLGNTSCTFKLANIILDKYYERKDVQISYVNDSTIKYYLPKVEEEKRIYRYYWFCYFLTSTDDGSLFREGIEGIDFPFYKGNDSWPKIQISLPKIKGDCYYNLSSNIICRQFKLGCGDEIIISSERYRGHPTETDSLQLISISDIRVGDQEDKDYFIGHLLPKIEQGNWPSGYRLLVLTGDIANIYIKAKQSNNALMYLNKILSGCKASDKALSIRNKLIESGHVPLGRSKDDYYYTTTRIDKTRILFEEKIQDREMDSLKFIQNYPKHIKIKLIIPYGFKSVDFFCDDRRFVYKGRDQILVKTNTEHGDSFNYQSSTQTVRIKSVQRVEEGENSYNPYGGLQRWYPYYNYWDKVVCIRGEDVDVFIRSRSESRVMKMLEIVLSGCDLNALGGTPETIIKELKNNTGIQNETEWENWEI